MRKLELNVEALAVESFETAASPAARGTVRGRGDADAAAIDTTVDGQPTCLIGVCTCWHTCITCIEPTCPDCPASPRCVMDEPAFGDALRAP